MAKSRKSQKSWKGCLETPVAYSPGGPYPIETAGITRSPQTGKITYCESPGISSGCTLSDFHGGACCRIDDFIFDQSNFSYPGLTDINAPECKEAKEVLGPAATNAGYVRSSCCTSNPQRDMQDYSPSSTSGSVVLYSVMGFIVLLLLVLVILAILRRRT